MGVLGAEAGLTVSGLTSAATGGVPSDSSADGADNVGMSAGDAVLSGCGATGGEVSNDTSFVKPACGGTGFGASFS